MMRLLTAAAILFAFYLLLAGALGTAQFVSAAILTVLILGWSMLIRRFGSERSLSFSKAHWSPWVRASLRLPGDTLRIGGVLLKTCLVGGSPGRAVAPKFRFGTVDDPSEAARCATAVIAGSLTPDFYVVDITSERACAYGHKLLKGDGPNRPDWLA